MPEDRRHIAVMFTDIVGYTALMGSDEDKAFDILKRNHAIHENLINKYNGTLIKEIGDGTLASFPLASEAVRCAIEIQKETKDQDIPLKIGIHQGEMVMAGGDVLGDGVNVASRLQEASKEGCITISGKVYSDIHNKVGIKTKYLGEKKLKNVEDPVKVYEVLYEEEKKQGEDKPLKSKVRTLFYILLGIVIVLACVLIWQFFPLVQKKDKTLENISDKSIAVIPFWDDSPDSDNVYFCSGMEEEIRIHLLKIADLKIESRQSVEKYRENPDIDAITIGKELDVAFIVEGSVQKIEDDIRVRIQLINAKTGDHIWAETYDGDYTTKLFEFQSNTAKQIASSLNAVITPEEIREIDQVPTADMRAYDLIIRAKNEVGIYWNTRDTKPLKLAHKLIDKALEIDPQYEDALSIKSGVYVAEQNYDSAYYYAKKLLEIYPESSKGYEAFGEYYRFKGNGAAAIENYELALKYHKAGVLFEKSYIEFQLGILYCIYNNDYEKGMKFIQKGINDADSINYVHWGYLQRIFLDLGDYEKAKEYNRKMFQESEYGLCWGIMEYSLINIIHGNFKQVVIFLDSICSITLCESQCSNQLFWNYTLLGQYEEAEKYFKQFKDVGGTPSVWDSLLLAFAYVELGKEKEAKIILNNCQISLESNLAQNRNWFTYICLSMTHAMLEENEESMNYLSHAVEMGLKVGWHDFLPVFPIYKNYWDDPDFVALVQEAQEERAAKRKQVEEMIERGEIDL